MLLGSRISPKPLAKRLHFFHRSFLSLDAYDIRWRDQRSLKAYVTAAICLRPGAGTEFIWPWQSAPKLHPSSLLRFLFGLTSLLFQNPFTFDLNFPESLKQQCTVPTPGRRLLRKPWATVDHVTSRCLTWDQAFFFLVFFFLLLCFFGSRDIRETAWSQATRCPVIHIERKKTLKEKGSNEALRERYWWNLRLQEHRRERQIIYIIWPQC